MDNQRLLVWAAFGLMLWFTYNAWVQDYAPEPVRQAEPAADRAATPPGTESSGDSAADLPALPEDNAGAPQLEAESVVPEVSARESDADVVRVTTDVLDLEISTRGGTLRKAVLPRYPVAKDQPDVLVQLLSPTMPDFGVIQTGLRTANEGPEPNHLAKFLSNSTEYSLDGRDELLVSLTWNDGQGVSVVKQFRFTRGSYIIGVQQTVTNETGGEWRGAEYAQIQRHSYPQDRSMFDVDSYSFHGPVVYDGERSSKLDRVDTAPLSERSSSGGRYPAALQRRDPR